MFGQHLDHYQEVELAAQRFQADLNAMRKVEDQMRAKANEALSNVHFAQTQLEQAEVKEAQAVRVAESSIDQLMADLTRFKGSVKSRIHAAYDVYRDRVREVIKMTGQTHAHFKNLEQAAAVVQHSRTVLNAEARSLVALVPADRELLGHSSQVLPRPPTVDLVAFSQASAAVLALDLVPVASVTTSAHSV